MKASHSIMIALALAAACLGAQAEKSSMSAAQAQTYFAGARLKSDGSLDGTPTVAAVWASASGAASRLELWRKTAEGFELYASAPKAGCSDCSGPTGKPNPSRLWFADGALNVEYQGGGDGFGFWAWRSSWSWDPALSNMRAVATQRIGADGDGEARHAIVDFVSGNRTERLKADGSVKSSLCRAAIARAPKFADLSLPALFDGTLEPDCLAGTETGDPLASVATPGGGALDNMMRASKPTASSKPSKL